MYKFSVRPAVDQDAASIFRINNAFEGIGLFLEETQSMLREIISDETSVVLVAVNSGHVVGYVHAVDISSLMESRYVEIVGLGINAYYREKGAAIALLRAIQKWAEQMTAKKIIFPIKTSDEEKLIFSLKKENYIQDERSMIFVRSV